MFDTLTGEWAPSTLDTATTDTEYITVDDPRVQDIAEITGQDPSDVLADAQSDAEFFGDTVSEELDDTEDMVAGDGDLPATEGLPASVTDWDYDC